MTNPWRMGRWDVEHNAERCIMEISWFHAVFAGILGTALMTLAIVAGRVMGLATDMIRVLGLAFRPETRPGEVYVVGLVVHFLFGMGFGIVYAILLTLTGAVQVVGAAAAYGALFGALHGGAVGAALGAMPAVHPRMGTGQVVDAPGFFGRNMGLGMPVGLVLLHIVYGVAASVFYSVMTVGA